MSRSKPQLVIPTGHVDRITFSIFSPNGKYLLTGSKDTSIKLWNRKGKLIMTFEDSEPPIIARYLNSKVFFTGYKSGRTKAWVSNRPKSKSQVEGEDLGPVEDISSNGHKIVYSIPGKSSRGDQVNKQQIGIWNGGKTLCEMASDQGLSQIQFTKDGNKVVAISRDDTIRVWNSSNGIIDGKAPGKLLHTLKGHVRGIYAIGISPDSNTLISGGHGDVMVWDLQTGTQRSIDLDKYNYSIKFIQYAADGASLLIGSTKKMILWDAKSYQQISEPIVINTENQGLTFSPDLSAMAVRAYEKNTKIIELPSLIEYPLETYARRISNVVISLKKDFIALVRDYQLRLWPFNTNQPTINYELEALEVYNLNQFKLVTDTGELLLGDDDGSFKVLDENDFSIKQNYFLPDDPSNVSATLFSSDFKKAVVPYMGERRPGLLAYLYEREEDGEFSEVAYLDIGGQEYTSIVALSNSGDKIAVSTIDGKIWIWDWEAGKVEKELEPTKGLPKCLVWSPDGKKIAAGLSEGRVFMWDIEKDYEATLYETYHHEPLRMLRKQVSATKIQFTPDGNKLITYYSGTGCFVLMDIITREELLVIKGYGGTKPLMFFSEDSRFLFIANGGNDVSFWDIQAYKKLASLYFLGETEWAITTPSGLFDASEGAMNMMHYVASDHFKTLRDDFEIIELEQLKDRYYEPGLLNKILEEGTQSLRDVSELNKVDLYPEVKAYIIGAILSIELTKRSGGLGKVELYINGKIVWEEENKDKENSFDIDLKDYNKYMSTREDNIIAVRVYNESGWLVSPEIIAARIDEAGAKAAGRGGGLSKKKKKKKRSKEIQHKLYALFVGTGTYRGSGMNLKYPEKDAAAMSKALGEVSGNLFGASNQDIRLLTTKEKDASKKPSKANIKKALEEFAAVATADDVCFLYFSGHGDNWGSGDQSQFYYLTYELLNNDISDEAIRNTQTISSAELSEWINKIACKLQVLVLDACHSGNVVSSLLAGKKAVDTARIKALDRMKDRTGMFVLAGSPGDKVSYETSHFGQGLLTYSLLFGMKGASHIIEGGDKFIDVMKLLQYSRDRVPQLAKEIDKVQQPILATPKGGDSFDIGIFDENVKIELTARRPIIIQSILLNRNTYYDNLSLTETLDQRLLQENAYANTARLTFVNISKFRNAYTLRGLYDEKGSMVEVDVKVYKEGKEETQFKLEKSKSDIKSLTEEIVEKLAMLPV